MQPYSQSRTPQNHAPFDVDTIFSVLQSRSLQRRTSELRDAIVPDFIRHASTSSAFDNNHAADHSHERGVSLQCNLRGSSTTTQYPPRQGMKDSDRESARKGASHLCSKTTSRSGTPSVWCRLEPEGSQKQRTWFESLSRLQRQVPFELRDRSLESRERGK